MVTIKNLKRAFFFATMLTTVVGCSDSSSPALSPEEKKAKKIITEIAKAESNSWTIIQNIFQLIKDKFDKIKNIPSCNQIVDTAGKIAQLCGEMAKKTLKLAEDWQGVSSLSSVFESNHKMNDHSALESEIENFFKTVKETFKFSDQIRGNMMGKIAIASTFQTEEEKALLLIELIFEAIAKESDNPEIQEASRAIADRCRKDTPKMKQAMLERDLPEY